MGKRGGPPLVVEVVTPGGVPAPGLARWLESVAPARARGTVTVALVPDARVRALNRRYRNTDRPTDVLSFPSDEHQGTPLGRPARAGRRASAGWPCRAATRHSGRQTQLGDVVISLGVARRQAEAAGHAFGTELRVLALHGLLHLLGYDHERDDGQMARLERRLRRKGGLREGLIERAPRLHPGYAPRPGSGHARA